MDSITQAVRALPEGQHMTLDKIRGSVQQLAADSVGYLSRAGERGGPAEGGNSFVISILYVNKMTQNLEFFNIYLLSIKGRRNQKLLLLLRWNV